jgi:hypothetical protein
MRHDDPCSAPVTISGWPLHSDSICSPPARAWSSKAELDAAEVALGRSLPAEHRALVAIENGAERWYGDACLMIYGIESLIAVNRQIEGHPSPSVRTGLTSSSNTTTTMTAATRTGLTRRERVLCIVTAPTSPIVDAPTLAEHPRPADQERARTAIE